MSDPQQPKPTKAPRGFAAMDSQRQREIASQGGKAAHRSGKAHQFSPEEARAAGAVSHASRRAQAASRSAMETGAPQLDTEDRS